MTFGPRSAVSAAVHWLCWFVLCVRCTLQLLLSITFGICCPSRSRHFSFPYLKNGAPLRVFLPSILFDVVSCRWGFFFFREVKVTEVKPKEVQLSVERVPGTLSTASKSVQVNGAATVSIDFFFSFLMLTPLLRHLNQIKSISAWTKGGGV